MKFFEVTENDSLVRNNIDGTVKSFSRISLCTEVEKNGSTLLNLRNAVPSCGADLFSLVAHNQSVNGVKLLLIT